jgi:hypothetical protein
MIFVGRVSLERAIAEYVAHYQGERSHQGLENEIPEGSSAQSEGSVQVAERLGGLLRSYQRAAA